FSLFHRHRAHQTLTSFPTRRSSDLSAAGPEGLLKGKKATLLMASGGVYESGSAFAAFDFVTPYLRTVFGFQGVMDVTFIAAGGTDRKSTRLNSSHVATSYAVFCLKK